MSLNAYEYHISSQINAEQLMSNVHSIGYYQRDTDWSTIDCDNVIGGLFNKFDELHQAAVDSESGEEQTRKVIPIASVTGINILLILSIHIPLYIILANLSD